MAEELNIGSLSIEIDGQTHVPSQGIKNLADAIKELRGALRGSFSNIRKLADYIKDLGEAMNYLPSPKRIHLYTEFFNSLKGMGNFGKKQFQEAMAGAASYADNMEEARKATMSAENSIIEFGKQEEFTFSNETYDKYRQAAEEFKEYATSINYLNQGMSTSLVPTEFQENVFEASYVDITDVVERAQQLHDILKNIGLTLAKGVVNGLKNVGKRISTMFKQIKRIAFYRLVRTVMKEITKAISEGMKMMYEWSKTNDILFKRSMDSIASSANYLKNSVGAILNPIIKTLAPILERITDSIANSMNDLAKFFAMMRGDRTFVKATKEAKEYGDTLKKQFLGIDELHKVGDSSEGSYVTETIKSTEKLTLFARNLKNLFTSILTFGGKIYNDLIKPLINALSPIARIIVAIFEPLVTFVFDALGIGLDAFGNAFDNLVKQLEGIADTCEYIMDKYISPIFTTISDIIHILVNMFKVGQSILTFDGSKITQAWNNLTDSFNGAYEHYLDRFDSHSYALPSIWGDLTGKGQDSEYYINITMDGEKVYAGVEKFSNKTKLASNGGGGKF